MRQTLSIAAFVAAAACAEVPTARAQVATTWSAAGLLHECWNYPAETDARYRGKVVRVSGLVQSPPAPQGHGAAVHLEVSEKGYFVECDVPNGRSLRPLETAQLVVVDGYYVGTANDRPRLADCAVVWPTAPRVEPPSVVGASATLCIAAEIRSAILKQKSAYADTKLSPTPWYADGLARTVAQEELANEMLRQGQSIALPCGHPLVSVVIGCVPAHAFAWFIGFFGLPPPAEPESTFLGAARREARSSSPECSAPEIVSSEAVIEELVRNAEALPKTHFELSPKFPDSAMPRE